MPKVLNSMELQFCDIQGRLFENSLKKNLDSEDFIQKFMNSQTCDFFDLPYDRHQWAGEEYILEAIMEEIPIKPQGSHYGQEVLYWVGYVYRYWHLLTGESSRDIYAQADAKLMGECYLGFCTLNVVMAVEDLKEIHRQRSAINSVYQTK